MKTNCLEILSCSDNETLAVQSNFIFLSTENIRLKHLVSNDSSDSEDESQHPKGKEIFTLYFIVYVFHHLSCSMVKFVDVGN